MDERIISIRSFDVLRNSLKHIITMLRDPLIEITLGGETSEIMLVSGEGYQLSIEISLLNSINCLYHHDDSLRCEEIYIIYFILTEFYRRLRKLHSHQSRFIFLRTCLNLSDHKDLNLDRTGVIIENIDEVVTKYRKKGFILIGDGGVGKTTLLRQYALDLAFIYLRDPKKSPLPIYLDLSKYNGEPPNKFIQSYLCKLGLTEAYVDTLAGRQTVILFDNVDYISKNKSRKIFSQWAGWINKELLSNKHVVILASRNNDCFPNLYMPTVRIIPLSNELIRYYLDTRFGNVISKSCWANIQLNLDRFGEQYEKLVRHPFLLTLIADNYSDGRPLFENRATLIKNFVERLLVSEISISDEDLENPLGNPRGKLKLIFESLSVLAYVEGTAVRNKRTSLKGLRKKLVHHFKNKHFLSTIFAIARNAGILEDPLLTDDNSTEPLNFVFFSEQIREYFEGQIFLSMFAAGENISNLWQAKWYRWKLSLPSLSNIAETIPSELEQAVIFAVASAGSQAAAMIKTVAQHNLPLAGLCLADIFMGRQDLFPMVESLRADLLSRQRDDKTYLRARLDAGLALGQLGHPELTIQEFEFEDRYVRAILPPMQSVPAGSFILGSHLKDKEAYDVEKTVQRHRNLSSYSIGRYPVTNFEFKLFIDAGGYYDKRWWSDEGIDWGRCQGMSHITAIADWLEYRKIVIKLGVDKAAKYLSWPVFTRNFWNDVVSLDDVSAQNFAYKVFKRSCNLPAYWNDPSKANTQPVVGINLYEAEAYCRWLSAVTKQEFRLPSELEWEKASRGPANLNSDDCLDDTAFIYPWGNKFDKRNCNSAEIGIHKPTPVGMFFKGISPYGVMDASGNVWEWTDSWFQAYPGSITNNEDFGERYHVVRGGSWRYNRRNVRCATRLRYVDSYFSNSLGFRMASDTM